MHALDEVIERFDHRPNRAKMVAARIAEFAGRLKLNGTLRRYSSLSRLVEIEVLSAGILTKESWWQALAVVQKRRPELAGIDFEELQRRARQQRELLEAHRAPAADEAFVAA